MPRLVHLAALAILPFHLSVLAAAPASDRGTVLVPEACFQMGSPSGDGDERPVHKVCLDAFRMDRTEVSNAQFSRTMGRNPHVDDGTCYVWDGAAWSPGVLPRKFRGPNQPAVCVDHDQARDFCGRRGGRLPTEAQWEYAARAGSPADSVWRSEAELGRHAWYRSNSGGSTHAVAQKRPNAWGLHDMFGNAWEWVEDWYGAAYYGESPVSDPRGPEGGAYRVYRGGGWFSAAQGSGASVRGSLNGRKNRSTLGFRCVDSL
jgi:formylglycine-generating enzyme required for sulfatase activity